MNSQINISVIGAGYLGEYHIMQLQKINNINLIGFYDISKERSRYIHYKYGINHIDKEELFMKCDAVCIVTPTNTHFDIAKQAIENNCHVFIEKPITQSTNESSLLIDIAKSFNVYIQVGHIERFNPAYKLLLKENSDAEFIECHRLAKAQNRGKEVSVILDLMIHDIDLIYNLKGKKIDKIEANGVSVMSNSLDIANARLTFEDGCVANLTASRISKKSMRKIRIFSKGSYFNVNLLNKNLKKYIVDKHTQKIEKDCTKQQNITSPRNALNDELNEFIKCIINKKEPIINGINAQSALKIALQIQDEIIG